MWLALLFVHVFGLAGFNLSLRKSLLGKTDPFTLATIMQTSIAIPAVFLMIYRPMTLGVYQPRYALGFVVELLLTVGLMVSNVKSLQYLEASVYPMLYNLRILITTVLGVLFLNESMVWLRIFGGLLILLSIFIVRQKGGWSLRSKGVAWGLTAAFVISFLNLNEKLMIANVGFFNYYPEAMVITAIIMWLYLLARDGRIDRSVILRPQTAQLMVLRAISGYAFIGAFVAGALLDVATYISAMSVIVMVVLGVLLLGEHDYLWRKAIATAVAVTGLTVVLLTHLL
jgi:drug/metabolite transporter (DMT)-like permease